ncbi:hypothetical protein [Arthrobacter sp. 2MCAF14]|uniref:hypothetical protein n=1 Tax=Arthrobacter sp. 2MCAF14 TaxID=3232982 RepID=UPI003F9267CD
MRALQGFKSPDDPGTLPGALDISRPLPTADRQIVDVDLRGGALTTSTSVFPEVDPSTGRFSSGASGLWMPNLHNAVELRHLGHSGS